MEVSYVEKRSRDDLRLSAVVGDRIFFVEENRLVSRCIYSYDSERREHQGFAERIDQICQFRGCVVVLCGNTLHRYKVFGDELVLSSIHQLREPPVKVFPYEDSSTKEAHAVCFLYREKGIEILTEDVERVTVCCKGEVIREDEIVDFFLTDTSSWFLARSGNIYHTHPFVLTRAVLFKRPVRMLPEPTMFGGAARGIVVRGQRLYLSYDNGFEVYDIHRNVLVLNYTYRTCDFSLVVSGNVFCIEDNLLVVDEAPQIIANVRIQRLFGRTGISADKIVFIRERGEAERHGVQLLKEGNASCRAREMLRMVDVDFKVGDIEWRGEGKVPEKTFLVIQKVVNDFESRVLDGYRRMYFELMTLNESFGEKMRGLCAENREMLSRADVLDERKGRVVERLRRLNDRMEEVVSGMRIDGGEVLELASRVSRTMDGLGPKRYEKYSKILRMQREILSRRMG